MLAATASLLDEMASSFRDAFAIWQHDVAQRPAASGVDLFDRVEIDGERMTLIHRFLPDPPLVIQPKDDVVSMMETWIKNFETSPR